MLDIWNIRQDSNHFFLSTWPAPLTVGIGLILSAIVIFIMPEIVAYLVGMLMLWGGIMMISFALKARKVEKSDLRGQRHHIEIW